MSETNSYLAAPPPEAELPAATTVPAVTARHRLPRAASIAALGMLVLLVAGVAVSVWPRAPRAPRPVAARTPAPAPVANVAVTESGRAYTPANLAGLVPAILGTGHAAPGAAAGGPLGLLATDPVALRACERVVSEGSGGPALVPLAVDLGSWSGAPAAVLVLPVPGHATSADVFVEGAGCAAGRDATLFYERTRRPSSTASPSGPA